MLKQSLILPLAIVGFLGFAACSQTKPSSLKYTVAQVRVADESAVHQNVELALVSEGYRIDKRDFNRGLFVTEAIPVGADRDIPRLRPSISRMQSRREMAEVQIVETDEGFSIYCKVEIQELVSEAHRMFHRDLNVSDTPGETPIDRDAALTEEQKAVWRTIHRDRTKERRIVSLITGMSDDLMPGGMYD